MPIRLTIPSPTDPEHSAQAEAYQNYTLLDILKWSKYLAVDGLVNHVLEIIKPTLKSCNRNSAANCVRVVLLNLFVAYHTDKPRYVAYHRGNGAKAYRTKIRKIHSRRNSQRAYSKYNPSRIGSVALVKVIDAMQLSNLIQDKTGYPSQDFTGHGELSKMRSTDILQGMFVEFSITSSMVRRKGGLIVLRAKKTEEERKNKKSGELMYYDPNDRRYKTNLKRMKNNLLKINAVIESNQIFLRIKDTVWLDLNRELASRKDKAPIDYSHNVLKRVFNDGSFEKGGRFYGGWWLRIPKEYRKHITINCKETEELDYSSLHPNIAYALEKIDLPEGYDPYVLDGFEGDKTLRKIVKLALLIIFNANCEDDTLYTINDKEKFGYTEQDLPAAIGTFDKLLDLIEQKHTRIKDKYFYSDKGKELQFHDSELAEQVMLRYIERTGGASAILPVHDSFIVRCGAGARIMLKDFMEDCFFEKFGAKINVDLKRSVLDEELQSRVEKAKLDGSDPYEITEGVVELLEERFTGYDIYEGFLSDK